MNAQDERSVPLGQHSVHIDGDTLIMTARNVLTGEDMQQLLDHFARIKSEHGRLFVLYDGRRCTSLDAAARRVATRPRPYDAEADLRVVFGLPFAIRVILNMIIRARRILANLEITVHIFEHEKEAYAFFEKERARIRLKKGIKPLL